MQHLMWGYSVFLKNLIEKCTITFDAPKNENGLIQMIMMGKSIHHKYVKTCHKNLGILTKSTIFLSLSGAGPDMLVGTWLVK